MRLVTYGSEKPRVGVIEGETIVDVGTTTAFVSKRRGPRRLGSRPAFKAAARVVLESGPAPRDMIRLLERGEAYRTGLGVITAGLAEAFELQGAPERLLTPLASARLRAPIARPPKIVCVGLNYADHAREQGREPPSAPVFFLKSANTVCGPGDPIVLPPNSAQVDYEAELAVVIGRGGRRIPVERAYEHIAGYMILNDVTARDMQLGDKQWFRGKSCDTFAPCGPWIVTREEIPDPHRLGIALTLNGQTMQGSSTDNLIFKLAYLLSYLSQSMTWEVGDVISTGTPAGVGVFRKPPVFMKAGDTVSVTLERVGTLTNPVVGPMSD